VGHTLLQTVDGGLASGVIQALSQGVRYGREGGARVGRRGEKEKGLNPK
jgi:hypothetical protein